MYPDTDSKSDVPESSQSSGGHSCSSRGPLLTLGGHVSPSLLPTSPADHSFRPRGRENNEQKLFRDGITVHSYGSLRHDIREQEPINATQPILRNSHAIPGEGDMGLIHARGVTSEWEEAGQINATWWRESLLLFKSSLPLMVTFILQYSLTIASILSAGNLGKNELAAVSLAGMTGSITGYYVFQGRVLLHIALRDRC